MTRTHFIVALATTAIISAFSAPAQSSIFYPDDRQYVQPTQGSPYSPVGVVYAPGLFVYHFTTGFLVDDCHVLTSQVVAGYGETPLGKRLKFKAAFGTSQHQSSKATVVAGGGFTPGRTSQEQIERGGRDWLLLRLDKCLGASLGHVLLKTGPYSPFEFRDLKSAGYPMSRSNNGGVTIDPSCKVVGGYSTLWMNDCPLARGDGGDPIFRIST